MPHANDPILIVGGGLTGLSSALFLAGRGVPTVLVERYPGSSPHPRAIGFTARTVELLRSVGLGPQIPLTQRGGRPRRVRVESLAGQWLEEQPWSASAQASDFDYSPCTAANITQDRLEPLLRDKAIDLGADIRLSTELLSFAQEDDRISARLRDNDGREYDLRASWLIAADGHRSLIRDALGIGRKGRGRMRIGRSVLFSAPLDEYLQKGFVQFTVDQPGLQGFLTTYGDGRWVLMLSDDEERNPETWRDLLVRAIGRSDLDIEIITTGRWEISALIADRFSQGRVFLAGDAAHALPPNRGGYGANTGIEDAHNLAWKLAAVLSGEASPALLDTYEAERRPIAWLRHDQIFARDDFAADREGRQGTVAIIDDRAMEFGQLYRSQAVLGAGEELPPADLPNQWRGQPGTRAPHLWITRNGERISTLDLFGGNWILVAADECWSKAVSDALRALNVSITCRRVGGDFETDEPEAFMSAFGISRTGGSLIRPDGYVAWRAPKLPPVPTDALVDALEQMSTSAATGSPACRGCC